jgi:hypothetical protein
MAASSKEPKPDKITTLNLKVPASFKRRLKMYAADKDRSMVDIVIESVDARFAKENVKL